MKIFGLQKMTLLDFPGRVACTVFLGGCNFRCPYCHNFELVTGEARPVMSENELFSFLEKRHGLLDGVAITGGEPCIEPSLIYLILKIKEMGFAVKLDTNGMFPSVLENLLKHAKPDYIAMDIKNSPDRYAETVGLKSVDLSRIEKSINLIMNSEIEYEFRTTVIDELHSKEDFTAIGKMINGANKYFLQPFTDRDTVPYAGFHTPTEDKIKTYLEIVRPYVTHADLRGV